MWLSIITVEGAAGAFTTGWRKSFGQNARYLQAEEASLMENRTAFWQRISKRQERTTSKSERRHHGACGPSAFTVKLVESRMAAFERTVA
jgi:phosphoribulokinase